VTQDKGQDRSGMPEGHVTGGWEGSWRWCECGEKGKKNHSLAYYHDSYAYARFHN